MCRKPIVGSRLVAGPLATSLRLLLKEGPMSHRFNPPDTKYSKLETFVGTYIPHGHDNTGSGARDCFYLPFGICAQVGAVGHDLGLAKGEQAKT